MAADALRRVIFQGIRKPLTNLLHLHRQKSVLLHPHRLKIGPPREINREHLDSCTFSKGLLPTGWFSPGCGKS
jgi:hypothetical protein